MLGCLLPTTSRSLEHVCLGLQGSVLELARAAVSSDPPDPRGCPWPFGVSLGVFLRIVSDPPDPRERDLPRCESGPCVLTPLTPVGALESEDLAYFD